MTRLAISCIGTPSSMRSASGDMLTSMPSCLPLNDVCAHVSCIGATKQSSRSCRVPRCG